MLFLVLSAFILAAEASPHDLSSHTMNTPMIINGQPAAKGRWPWQLALEYQGSHTCGATLIALTKALTAAHCVDGREVPSRFTLVVGASDRSQNDEEEIRSVIAISKHPSYVGSSNNFAADVAVLTLDRAVTLNQYVAIATLAAKGSTWVGRETWISGWGKISGSASSVTTQLMEVRTDVISTTDCASRMPVCCRDISIVHQCVYTGDNGVCQGDSGGPLHVFDGSRWYVDGAASWVISSGSDSCSTSYPSVYARVSEYRDWILAQ